VGIRRGDRRLQVVFWDASKACPGKVMLLDGTLTGTVPDGSKWRTSPSAAELVDGRSTDAARRTEKAPVSAMRLLPHFSAADTGRRLRGRDLCLGVV